MTTWKRIDSNGHDWVTRGRKHLANVLAQTAQRLDPDRPVTTRGPSGSYTIGVYGIDLARIDPGQIATTR